MKVFVSFFIVQLYINCGLTQQGTYKAAVVEYDARLTADVASERILENVKQYTNMIEEAADKNVQIIVFPEDGLTGWDDITEDNIEDLSTEVPDLKEGVSPCFFQSPIYSKPFIDLSCSANTHKIYVVVNLIEKVEDPVAKKNIYYNTNVVFDRTGTVIARYRKMNLFNEPLFAPGNATASFKTDFGVTFGMFICFDILFKNSSIDVLIDPAVTDVVYSTAWFSELPFLEALSVQHGYATSLGVNLLAAGFDNPSKQNGGSGIFLANGKIAEMYISGAKSSKMIIQDVPKINSRTPSAACQVSGGVSQRGFGLGIGGGVLPDISAFQTRQEDMTNYTFKSLDLDKQIISETICSGGSKFCCSFNITVMKDPSIQPNYVYKLAAFYGVRQTSLTKTLGIRNCGLVACLNENNSTCGGRHTLPPTGVTFENIQITGSFTSKTTHDQPATLNHDLKPITEYTFCRKEIDSDKVTVTMATTSKQNSLLTFGIHGRVYSNDDKPRGPINRASFHYVNIYVVFLISIVIFLLQD